MSIAALLDAARQGLLDLSVRNRLLNLPRDGRAARLVQVYDEMLLAQGRLRQRDGWLEAAG